LQALDAASRATLADGSIYRKAAQGSAGEDSFSDYERVI
jgi:hypothetical protein